MTTSNSSAMKRRQKERYRIFASQRFSMISIRRWNIFVVRENDRTVKKRGQVSDIYTRLKASYGGKRSVFAAFGMSPGVIVDLVEK